MLRGSRRGNIAGCSNYVNADPHKLSGQCWQCLIIGARPTLDNADIAALDEAAFAKPSERV
jgi:hypothetical protein